MFLTFKKRERCRDLENFYFQYKFPIFYVNFLKLKNTYIYLFLAALGPACCAGAFSSSEQGLLSSCRFLIVVASLLAEHGLLAHGLQWLWFRGLDGLVISGIFQTRDQTCVPCVDRWLFNHWTTRGVQMFFVTVVFLSFTYSLGA